MGPNRRPFSDTFLSGHYTSELHPFTNDTSQCRKHCSLHVISQRKWSLVQGYARALSTSLVVPALVSITLLPSVHATKWVGNDNGEWQESNNPARVQVEAWLSPQGLFWSSSPPYNHTSLQYNPDKDLSFWYQNYADWFQT